MESSAVLRPRFPSRVGLAGAVVGVLDAVFAVTLYSYVLHRAPPARILQSIAAALLGSDAFEGGAPAAALGLLLNFAVAYSWTLVYAFLWLRWERLRALTSATPGAIAAGLVLGAAIWVAMDLVVLPLTRARVTPIASPTFVIQLVWHAIGLGIPMALIVRDRGSRRLRET